MRKGNFKNENGFIVNWDILEKIKDPKQWFVKSHCGPGSSDENLLCECGKTGPECAKTNTKYIKKHHKQNCGWSGFWCWNCGRFYANDTCGETYDDEFKCIDGSDVIIKENFVFCKCGAKLFKIDQFEEGHDGVEE